MIKQYVYLFVAALAITLTGCQNETKTSAAEELGIENAKDSINWVGTYEGTLPCEDCAGIETALVLNEDGTYELSENYIDGEELNSDGSFTWLEDNATIEIDGDTSRLFVVGDGTVYALDLDGHLVTGEMEGNYELTKTSADTGDNNQAVVNTQPRTYQTTDGSEYTIQFYEEDCQRYARVTENGEVRVLPLESSNEYKHGDLTLTTNDDQSDLSINGKRITLVSNAPTTYHYQRGEEEIWVAYHDNYVNITQALLN